MKVVFPRERPILFSGPMVREVLADRKLQTRRVVKTVEGANGTPLVRIPRSNAVIKLTDAGLVWNPHGGAPDTPWVEGAAAHGGLVACPYGARGDRLWVREAWGLVRMHEIGQHVYGDGPKPDSDRVVYRAGRQVRRGCDAPPDYDEAKWPISWADDPTPDTGRWRPSIHMRREYSRINLEVTGVRVERLQDISDSDVLAEGVDCEGQTIDKTGLTKVRGRTHFKPLWDGINGKRGFGWATNPWVWVVEFTRIDHPAR